MTDRIGFIGLGRMGRGMAMNLRKKQLPMTVYDVRAEPVRDVIAAGRRGTVVLDMSTVDPLATDRIAIRLTGAGMSFVDAPVGRLASHADRGESLFMVGASDEDFARVKPLLEAMGTTIHHC